MPSIHWPKSGRKSLIKMFLKFLVTFCGKNFGTRGTGVHTFQQQNNSALSVFMNQNNMVSLKCDRLNQKVSQRPSTLQFSMHFYITLATLEPQDFAVVE